MEGQIGESKMDNKSGRPGVAAQDVFVIERVWDIELWCIIKHSHEIKVEAKRMMQQDGGIIVEGELHVISS